MTNINIPAQLQNVTSTLTNESKTLNNYIVSLACVFYVVGYAGYLPFLQSSVRYTVYLAALALAISILAEPAPKINRPAATCFLIYLGVGAWSLFDKKIPGYFSLDSLYFSIWFNEFIIILFVIACYIPFLRVSLIQIRFVFACSVLFFLMEYYMVGGGSIRLLQFLQANPTGYDSTFGGLTPATYTIFFYALGAKIEFVFALMVGLLGGKRITIVAILVGLFSYYFFRGIEKKSWGVCFLLIALVTIDVVAVSLPSLAEYTHSSLRSGSNIEETMLGRQAIGLEIVRLIENRTWVEWLVGSGPGSADKLASLVSNGVLPQPHNDWLKIFFDYGFIGSALVNLVLALTFSSSRAAPAIAIAIAIVMATDNIIIYVFFHVPIALMIAVHATLCPWPAKAKVWTLSFDRGVEYSLR